MQVLSEGNILTFYYIERVNLLFCILEISNFISNFIDSRPSITLICKYGHLGVGDDSTRFFAIGEKPKINL